MPEAYYQDNRTEKRYKQCSSFYRRKERTESNVISISVVDPDPYVFGPSGSGFHYRAKKVRNLDFYCFVTYYDFLSLKTDVNVPSRRNRQKNDKSGSGSVTECCSPRIRIRTEMSRIQNTAFYKCRLQSIHQNGQIVFLLRIMYKFKKEIWVVYSLRIYRYPYRTYIEPHFQKVSATDPTLELDSTHSEQMARL
jgi:hypothetical protein